MLQNNRIGEHAAHGLRVAIPAGHGQVEPERVAVLHVDVARLTATQSVHSATERFVRLDENFDLGVAALNGNCFLFEIGAFSSCTSFKGAFFVFTIVTSSGAVAVDVVLGRLARLVNGGVAATRSAGSEASAAEAAGRSTGRSAG